MGTSVLIMIAGGLVPVLAAAPFYILDHRAERRAEEARLAEKRRQEDADQAGEDQCS